MHFLFDTHAWIICMVKTVLTMVNLYIYEVKFLFWPQSKLFWPCRWFRHQWSISVPSRLICQHLIILKIFKHWNTSLVVSDGWYFSYWWSIWPPKSHKTTEYPHLSKSIKNWKIFLLACAEVVRHLTLHCICCVLVYTLQYPHSGSHQDIQPA